MPAPPWEGPTSSARLASAISVWTSLELQRMESLILLLTSNPCTLCKMIESIFERPWPWLRSHDAIPIGENPSPNTENLVFGEADER